MIEEIDRGNERSWKSGMKKKLICVFFLGGSLLLAAYIQPCAAQNRGVFSFYLENDVFAGTDRYYTNGMKLTWVSPFAPADRTDPSARSAFSLSFGQNIYTPYDIERKDLIEDDRPYAGILYLSLALQRKKGRTMNTYEFLLGVVGPSSLAGQTQRFIHSLYLGTKPNGWDHQLKNEVVIDFVFDKKWRIFRSGEGKKVQFDLIGHAGASLGTMMTAAATGWQFRFGSNIPKDFGTFLLRPGGENGAIFSEQSHSGAEAKQWGVHGFIYLVGHVVYRNMFLDGNTFKESHRVDKYPYVGDIVLGFVVGKKRFRISYAYVFRTKQFKTQSKPHIFGTINISFAY